MGAQADVTADDLVSSLLHSITSGSGSAASSSSSSSSSASSASSSSASASASSSASSSGSSSAPAATTAAPVATTAAPSTPTPTTSVRGVDNGDASSDSGGSGAAVGIGLAMAALVMAAVVLLYLRRRKRIKAMKQRRDQFGGVDELGPAQPSIELPAPKRPLYRPSQDPGVRGSSMYSSSSSSRDGTSVFHTVGGLSPTSRKLGSQFRASSISSVDSVNLQAPAGATTSGRKLQRVMSGREMDENDELQYEQLKSTAANARVLDDRPTPLRLSNVSSVNSLHDSMSSDKYAHGDGLGATTAAAAPPQQQEPDRQQLSQALDSSLITGRTKRTGSVYDSIPALAGEQMTSEAPPTPAASGEAVTPAMGRRPPPPPPPAGVQAFQPMTEGGSYVAALPGGLTSFANADDLEFSMDAQMRLDAPSERASTMSTTSTDSGCTTRSGSLIGVVATSDADEIQI